MNTAEAANGRSRHLRAATSEAHARLDRRIMLAGPFASRERFARFLEVQHAFHREIDTLCQAPSLKALLPDLDGRRRFAQVEQDLADLGAPAPAAVATPVFSGEPDVPTALGWLYVAEGSNLGAAFLLKAAAKIGLSEEFGARHLAAHTEGRKAAWDSFADALDRVALSPEDEARVIAGGNAAFAHVYDLVEALMPLSEPEAVS
jgi:heme oxygenase (biliverdin-IX-beta and delta-forming)